MASNVVATVTDVSPFPRGFEPYGYARHCLARPPKLDVLASLRLEGDDGELECVRNVDERDPMVTALALQFFGARFIAFDICPVCPLEQEWCTCPRHDERS